MEMSFQITSRSWSSFWLHSPEIPDLPSVCEVIKPGALAHRNACFDSVKDEYIEYRYWTGHCRFVLWGAGSLTPLVVMVQKAMSIFVALRAWLNAVTISRIMKVSVSCVELGSAITEKSDKDGCNPFLKVNHLQCRNCFSSAQCFHSS